MFATRLRELRKKRGMTQSELAQTIGVERSSIGKYEGKDHVIPSEEIRDRIADYFNVTVDYLMGKTDSPYLKTADHLTDEEGELISIFRQLNAKGKRRIMDQAHDCMEIPSMQERSVQKRMA